MPLRTLALVVCALAGCATSGREFTGDPYDVIEHHGVLSGEACGLPVAYAVSRDHDATILLGRGLARLQVRDENGGRHITGVLGAGTVDLHVTAERLDGFIGAFNVQLAADGDNYRGTYQLTDDPRLGDVTLDGRQALLQLPRAALAALLPPLLSCERRHGASTRQPIAVRFGGEPHYETARAGNW